MKTYRAFWGRGVWVGWAGGVWGLSVVAGAWGRTPHRSRSGPIRVAPWSSPEIDPRAKLLSPGEQSQARPIRRSSASVVEDDHRARRFARPHAVEGHVDLRKRQPRRDHLVELQPTVRSTSAS